MKCTVSTEKNRETAARCPRLATISTDFWDLIQHHCPQCATGAGQCMVESIQETMVDPEFHDDTDLSPAR